MISKSTMTSWLRHHFRSLPVWSWPEVIFMGFSELRILYGLTSNKKFFDIYHCFRVNCQTSPPIKNLTLGYCVRSWAVLPKRTMQAIVNVYCGKTDQSKKLAQFQKTALNEHRYYLLTWTQKRLCKWSTIYLAGTGGLWSLSRASYRSFWIRFSYWLFVSSSSKSSSIINQNI